MRAKRPEGGNHHQAEEDVPALEEGGAEPDEMGNEDTGPDPVKIMDGPSRVRRVLEQLHHAGTPHLMKKWESDITKRIDLQAEYFILRMK